VKSLFVTAEHVPRLPSAEVLCIAGVAFVCYWILFFLSGAAFKRFSPAYRSFTNFYQCDWCSRIGSNVNAVLMLVLMFPSAFHEAYSENPLGAVTPWESQVGLALALGYFVYHSLLGIMLPEVGAMMMLHHLVSTLGAAIFLCYDVSGAYYFAALSLVEGSTVFVNQHHFLMHSSVPNATHIAVNALLAMASFLVCRLTFIPYLTWHVYVHAAAIRALPLFTKAYFAFAYLALNTLNVFWFYLMVSHAYDKLVKGDTGKDKAAAAAANAKPGQAKKHA